MADVDRLQKALWSTYFLQEGAEPLPVPCENCRRWFPLDLTETLKILVPQLGVDSRITPAIESLALWNLLDSGDELRRSAQATGTFNDLDRRMNDIFGYGIGVAEQTWEGRWNTGSLPPLRDVGVYDSSTRVVDDGFTAVATVEVLVNRAFEELQAFTQDITVGVKRAELFWNDVKWRNGRTRTPLSEFEVTLNIPNEPPFRVRLSVELVESTWSIRADFGLAKTPLPNAPHPFRSFSGFMEISKEAGRPGFTRFRQERRAAFTRWYLDNFRVQILAYWLQAESLALTLTPVRPVRRPHR